MKRRSSDIAVTENAPLPLVHVHIIITPTMYKSTGSTALKRLMTEYREITLHAPEGITAGKGDQGSAVSGLSRYLAYAYESMLIHGRDQ